MKTGLVKIYDFNVLLENEVGKLHCKVIPLVLKFSKVMIVRIKFASGNIVPQSIFPVKKSELFLGKFNLVKLLDFCTALRYT